MSQLVSTTTAEAASRKASSLSLPLLFGTTILSSACLLFSVQPLISKLILPWFGGSAAVWITSMLFFQAGLLLGYAYAHALTAHFGVKAQASIHLALLVLSICALPILPNARWEPAPNQDPTWLVFAALATSVGLPYAVLSATSPLLQSWYARSRGGALPYRYFALSNAGSLLALLAYPVAIEPYLRGHSQAWLWSIGYGLFAVLCGSSAIAVGKSHRFHDTPLVTENSRTNPAQIALWIALSAAPSILLLAVTNLLTQNIAPMPLLWVIPLAIYLLTFILCFESDRWYRRIVFLPLVLPALGCLAAVWGPLYNSPLKSALPLFCGALFICCMACHGELARMRPEPSRLTTFYLSLSVGGVVGGLFVALIAPRIFVAPFETSIGFVFCAVILLIAFWRARRSWSRRELCLSLWLSASAATVVLAGYLIQANWRDFKNARLLVRNFYGSLRVEDVRSSRGKVYRELSHGTITHGVQFLDPTMRAMPTSYYGRDSGIGLTWRILSRSGPLRMGVVGLGTGTLAAYGRGGDVLRFYDLNPLVVRLAKTQFTYLADCPAHIDIVPGDARLSMAREPNQNYDILVIDAFSGDAIPVHLLTREAFALYWRHLKPGGVLAVHISNRYLELGPVVALAAREMRKEVWEIDSDDDDSAEIYDASYVLVTNRPNFFASPLLHQQLSLIEIPKGLHTWTDDYSNLWQVLSVGGDR